MSMEKTGKFSGVLAEVPDYQVFLTVDELNANSRALAEEHPEAVRVRDIGRSKNGDQILALTIGKGRRNALLFACPHPNEPIGSMMLDFLARKLAEDAGFRESFDVTWHLIKCVDPDGLRLNEGWLKGPFTPRHYARNFFRPAGFQQAEWTFPIDYKTLHFNRPIPETRALMAIMEETKPDFMYSLHNAGFGGVYYYLSEAAPELYEPLTRLATDRDLPLSLGEPEMPYAVQFAPAIYRMPTTADSYDYLEQYGGGKDPAEMIRSGTSSFDHVRRFADTFVLVCEMPYFHDPRIADLSPASITRREAILEGAAITEEVYGGLRKAFAAVEGLLTEESQIKIAVAEFLRSSEEQTAAKRRWAESTPELARAATVAEVFDNVSITKFYSSLVLGMGLRLFARQTELSEAKGDAAAAAKLRSAHADLSTLFDSVVTRLEGELNYQVIPIKKLVEVQLGSALYVLNSLR